MGLDPDGETAQQQYEFDVVVVGAGPAGLACATTLLAETNLTVCMVDAGHGPGGQYWRQPAPAPTTPVLFPERAGLHHALGEFEALCGAVDRGRAAGRLTSHYAHHVWSVTSTTSAGTTDVDSTSYQVHTVDRSGRPGHERSQTVIGRALVIATGAFDRSLPFPGWDLPGVMTVGGLQALLKAGDVAAGQRVAIGGTGPFLLPVAAALAGRGSTVVGVFEANPPLRWLRELPAVVRNAGKLGEGAGYGATLLRHRVPLRPRRMIVAAHGTDRVEAVSVARLDRSGRPLTEGVVRHEVDAVGIGWGFTPQLDLAMTLGLRRARDVGNTAVVAVDELHRTSRERVYAAGEVVGVGGADLALVEGRLAARGVIADLAHNADGADGPHGAATSAAGAPTTSRIPGSSAARDLASARRLRGFGDAIMRAHPVPAGWADPLGDDTVVCRCEEVPFSAVRDAIAGGATDARQVKQLTRTGMGWCQGRVCGYAAALLSAHAPDQPGEPEERLVSGPVPLGALGPSANPETAM